MSEQSHPEHPHDQPPGHDPGFVPPGHGGTPPGQDEEQAEHPIVEPDEDEDEDEEPAPA